MQLSAVKNLFYNPVSYLSELPMEEFSMLSWYIKIVKQQFKNKGYFLNSETYKDLTFPSDAVFDIKILDSDMGDKDLTRVYRYFSWQCFLRYCQPSIIDGVLQGFAYKGNVPLDEDTLRYMLRFPSVDWINATLLSSSVIIPDNLRKLIEDNRIGYSRDIHCAFKQQQARFYAAIYLLDHLPFIVRTYDENFSNLIYCYTRCPELLRALVPNEAEELIHTLDYDEDFDTLYSGIITCVKLTAEETSGVSVEYKAELVELNMTDTFTQFLPFVAFSAYVDGFSERINDLPEKAALLHLDLQKTGASQRYCTLNQQVFRSVFEDLDKLQVNSRARFKCGLDIVDFSFKYWNLQSSIQTTRSYSAFSPFSLRGIQTFDLSKLSKTVLNANYAKVKETFTTAIKQASEMEAKLLASICGISPSRPALKSLLEEFMESKHPTELYKIILANEELFSR